MKLWRLILPAALQALGLGVGGCCGDGVDAVWSLAWSAEGKLYSDEHVVSQTSCPQSDQDAAAILGFLFRSKLKVCREHCASSAEDSCLYRCDRVIQLVTRTCEERKRPSKGLQIPIKI